MRRCLYILVFTGIQFIAMAQRQPEITFFKRSECNESCDREKIFVKEKRDSLFFLRFAIIKTCSEGDTVRLVLSNDTLEIKTTPRIRYKLKEKDGKMVKVRDLGAEYECDCYYFYEMHIKFPEQVPIAFKINDYVHDEKRGLIYPNSYWKGKDSAYPENKIFILKGLQFGHGSTSGSWKEGNKHVDSLAWFLRYNQHLNIEITPGISCAERKDKNINVVELSEARAKIIYDYLVRKKDLAPSRITLKRIEPKRKKCKENDKDEPLHRMIGIRLVNE